MRKTAFAVALLIALMGFVLPLQAEETSNRALDRVTDTREATQQTTGQHNPGHMTTTTIEPTNDIQSGGTRANEETSASTAVKAQKKLVVGLTGEAEVPAGTGDPDGSGVAGLRIRADEGTLCYSVRVSGIDPVVAGHIHEGGTDVDGPVVIDFKITEAETTTHDGTTAFWQCLSDLDATLLTEIEANPTNYYVNIHTSAYPDGAVRGQLGQSSADKH